MPRADQAPSAAVPVPEPLHPPAGTRIWFTLAALVVYRLGTYLSIPGISPAAFAESFRMQSSDILGMFNMLAGGAVERMAIFALGIMPYISASIIMQLTTSAVPTLEQLKNEGEQGRKRITRYTRYLTIVLAAFQAYAIAFGLEGLHSASGPVVIDPGWFFRTSAVVTLVGGAVFLMWLGEQITARGVGNGPCLIIISGIVAGLPGAFADLLELSRQGAISWPLMIRLSAVMLAVVAVIVFIERAERRLLIEYPERQMGDRMVQGDASYLPLKLNSSGVIPPIFASSLLIVLLTVAQFSAGLGSDRLNAIVASFARGQPLYVGVYVGMIVFFAFFYRAIVFNPQATADSLRKKGGLLPGTGPGANTAEQIDYVLTRITIIGAIYLSLVCMLPELLIYAMTPYYFFSGTALLIVVVGMLELLAVGRMLFRFAP
jgi:preprotein translocase subunit SecY